MSLVRFARQQTPREQRFWTFDLDQFLDADDEIVAAVATTTPVGLDVSTFILAPDNRQVVVTTADGAPVNNYKNLILFTTAEGGKREVRLDVKVSEP